MFAPTDKSVSHWTLAEVAARGSLHIECTRCWKISEKKPPELVDAFGCEATLGEITGRMRCGRCGAREARALVRLRGWRGFKAWRPTEPRGGR